MVNKRNSAWTITAQSPLLRPGLTISVEVSERYVVEETVKLMEKVREVNLELAGNLPPENQGVTPYPEKKS